MIKENEGFKKEGVSQKVAEKGFELVEAIREEIELIFGKPANEMTEDEAKEKLNKVTALVASVLATIFVYTTPPVVLPKTLKAFLLNLGRGYEIKTELQKKYKKGGEKWKKEKKKPKKTP